MCFRKSQCGKKMLYNNFHQAVVREVHNISIQVFAIRYYIVVVGKILHSGGGEVGGGVIQ